jgi:hypothetical protein
MSTEPSVGRSSKQCSDREEETRLENVSYGTQDEVSAGSSDQTGKN